jgi:ankyrin repeat protein
MSSPIDPAAFVDAAACGDLAEVKALLASSNPILTPEVINSVDKESKSAFHYACLNDDSNLLKILLADPRVNVTQTSKNGDTGMHMAALYSSLEAISLLHADGRVNINAHINKYV